MIYTITFNPSLDYIAFCDNLQIGETNRTYNESILLGGKGLNVSTVLNNLGLSSTALGFLAGFTGKQIQDMIEKEGIKSEMIFIDNGFSRINIKLKSDTESELNGSGPIINEEAIKKLYHKLDNIKENDILVLAGSIPTSMPSTIYSDIMKYLEGRNIKIIVDATKDLLMNVIPYRPFLIKPNNHELGELFNVTIKNNNDVIFYAKKLQELGARNVLVSLAKDGAILLSEDGQIYQSKPPVGKVINSTGAGDSMVAGFIYGYLTTKDYKEAFKYGICSGSATAFCLGLAKKEDIKKLLDNF